ncbi:hypothetical protein EIP91_002630 [Steccherinum ochraceum]|uniref:Uncharacterized protein n=1 Tax=Steccherinum ochraceum TaxID=92696 RepID=A0A4R0RP45_9APHY|nr:hypothetical protein EIP91_002630 [Steccherinum ochraceum]
MFNIRFVLALSLTLCLFGMLVIANPMPGAMKKREDLPKRQLKQLKVKRGGGDHNGIPPIPPIPPISIPPIPPISIPPIPPIPPISIPPIPKPSKVHISIPTPSYKPYKPFVPFYE